MTAVLSNPKRLRVHVFLALALAYVCAQQLAMRHWTLHAAASINAARLASASASKAPASADRCDDCTALCAFVGGLAAAEPGVVIDVAASPPATEPSSRGVQAALRLGFRSRAPPVLS